MNRKAKTGSTLICALLMTFTSPTASASPQIIEGLPSITDGDTIRIGDDRIRLNGMDAPEMKQTCTINNTQYRCGVKSKAYLVSIINKQPVYCLSSGKDRYKRFIATCAISEAEHQKGNTFGRQMVRAGWALAYRRYSKDYVGVEALAAKEGVGLWAGKFDIPWEWRRK